MSLSPAQKRQVLDFVELKPRDNTVVLVSCSKAKQATAAPARLLYSSDSFRKSIALSATLGLKHLILSAKYGVISPDCVLAPYDLSVHDLDDETRQEWANGIDAVLRTLLTPSTNFWILASQHYTRPLLPKLSKWAGKIHHPLDGLPIGKANGWLAAVARVIERKRLIAELYEELANLADQQGFRTLREVLSSGKLPKQGLYIFFDGSEPSAFSTRLPRIVRIGTHAVSAGSKTELRTRLRTHLGTKRGDGNHRGSIFRLHVGAAIAAKHGLKDQYSEWGLGQSAPKHVRVSELELEHRVSAYISSLYVLVVEIADVAGPKSKRAYFERELIALLTEDGLPLENAGDDWIGRFSDKPAIRDGLLWNINYVGERRDPSFIKHFKRLLSRAEQLQL